MMHRSINVSSPNNISKWHMGINSAFKGLRCFTHVLCQFSNYSRWNLNNIKSLKHYNCPILQQNGLKSFCCYNSHAVSLSVCQLRWLYVQSVCWWYCRAGRNVHHRNNKMILARFIVNRTISICQRFYNIDILTAQNISEIILNCKLYCQQLHLKYCCNLARYWLQAVWGWHDSVETCSSVIICEIIVCICRT
jgi:hypothetical protein